MVFSLDLTLIFKPRKVKLPASLAYFKLHALYVMVFLMLYTVKY